MSLILVLSSLGGKLYTRIKAKLGIILNYRYNNSNLLLQTPVTETEQKLAEIAQQIQGSPNLVDYDRAKHDARAECGHQANLRLTEQKSPGLKYCPVE